MVRDDIIFVEEAKRGDYLWALHEDLCAYKNVVRTTDPSDQSAYAEIEHNVVRAYRLLHYDFPGDACDGK
jgi:hypothetical protein